MKQITLVFTLFALLLVTATAQRIIIPPFLSQDVRLFFFKPNVNFESPHVHPLALSPNERWLVAVNSHAAGVEVFELVNGIPEHRQSLYTGIDPVTVRFRSDDEVWVVNHLSDSVTILSIPSGDLLGILPTHDEPADVIFSEKANKAFVSCSQVNELLAYDLGDLEAEPEVLSIRGEDPRALAASSDGRYVFAAVFESGNGSTVLGGGRATSDMLAYPPNVVNDPRGPYSGVNPPPNKGDEIYPKFIFRDKDLPVSLIVRKDAEGRWMDDNQGDWTRFVSGDLADASGRVEGWDLADHDIAIIDTLTNEVRYARSLMNICMAIDVNESNGSITIVGTDATNEVRFTPNLKGTFLRVKQATVRLKPDGSVETLSNTDLNPHLDYSVPTIPQEQRDLSIGDPRAVTWTRQSNKAYIAGMGSNNVVVMGRNGNRLLGGGTIEVGEGPTGLALNQGEDRLYVLNRFEGSISVIETSTNTEIERVSYFDPTPKVIREGRRHLYDTHKNSGLGQASCASCHVDGRMDRLAWDLGEPQKTPEKRRRIVDHFDKSANFRSETVYFDRMKGPMVTQTFQGLLTSFSNRGQSFHWRGDKDSFEDFNPTFEDLLGDDTQLTHIEMREFMDFLQTLSFPPNPYLKIDHSLPEKIELPNQTAVVDGEVVAMPAGDPIRGAEIFLSERLGHFEGRRCVDCHQNSGTGYNSPSAPTVTDLPALTQSEFKPSQLRNLYEKVGFDASSSSSLSGFGYLHDGSMDSLHRYLSQPQFEGVADLQPVADSIAFLFTITATGVTSGERTFASQDTRVSRLASPGTNLHSGMGKQLVIDPESNVHTILINRFLNIAEESGGEVHVIMHADLGGERLATLYDRNQMWITPSNQSAPRTLNEIIYSKDFRSGVLTLVHSTMVSKLLQDADGDGLLDSQEMADLDPIRAGIQNPFDPLDPDSTGDRGRTRGDGRPDGSNDFDGNSISNSEDFLSLMKVVDTYFDAKLVERDDQFFLTWLGVHGKTYLVDFSADLHDWREWKSERYQGETGDRIEWEVKPWISFGITQRYFRIRELR